MQHHSTSLFSIYRAVSAEDTIDEPVIQAKLAITVHIELLHEMRCDIPSVSSQQSKPIIRESAALGS